MSALQIQWMIGAVSYRTAWYMCHCVRAAMQDDSLRRLSEVVEIGETYIGHKARNHHGRGVGGGLRKGEGGRELWSLLKRGILGTYHNVSKDYLPMYLTEFAFRHNHGTDADLFTRVLATC